MQEPGVHPRVFISYSHDSPAHRALVLGLSERLRADGIDTRLDQYVNGTPPEGWPRWMLNQLDWAESVLVICTATYYRRFRGLEAPGLGKGVDWEGAVITQTLYDARSVTAKFIPVLFAADGGGCIPEPLRGQTFYILTADQSYQALYAALLGQAGIEPGALGLPRRQARASGTPLVFDDAGDQPVQPTAAKRVDEQTWQQQRLVLRDLLVALPAWPLVRERKAFVEAALGRHPAAANLIWDDDGYTVAANLILKLHFFDTVPLPDGRHAVCGLLAEIRARGWDLHPGIGEQVHALAAAFGCPAA